MPFGQILISTQVFYTTPLSFALVNLKPLLPGHVLVSPRRRVPRLTDLNAEEASDLFSAVQKVQRALAQIYFVAAADSQRAAPTDGGFTIAIQDGPDAGQTVPHVHCHVIPRPGGGGQGDDIYDRLASEEGNVGGALWDRDHRPQAGRILPRIEDSARTPRSAEDMAAEAQHLRHQMEALE
jgi:bis(5'-adenosyl)-triphosphatase